MNGNDSINEHNVIVGNILMFCCDKIKSTATLALIEIHQICVFHSNLTPMCAFTKLGFYSAPNDGCKSNWSACCFVRKMCAFSKSQIKWSEACFCLSFNNKVHKWLKYLRFESGSLKTNINWKTTITIDTGWVFVFIVEWTHKLYTQCNSIQCLFFLLHNQNFRFDHKICDKTCSW